MTESHFYVVLYVSLVSYANCNLSVKLSVTGHEGRAGCPHKCNTAVSAVPPRYDQRVKMHSEMECWWREQTARTWQQLPALVKCQLCVASMIVED